MHNFCIKFGELDVPFVVDSYNLNQAQTDLETCLLRVGADLDVESYMESHKNHWSLCEVGQHLVLVQEIDWLQGCKCMDF